MATEAVTSSREALHSYLVTAEQMQHIEQRIFSAGMPVSALMEKVGGLIVQWVLSHLDVSNYAYKPAFEVGVLAGPGHNGGDALVVARELHLMGYKVKVYQPFSRCKPLTTQHANYARSLSIDFADSVTNLTSCDVLIDGLFGFGLTRPITDSLADDIDTLNRQDIPIFSIDLPSGIHTDTGNVMGVAIKASYTACLGLWKRGFMQEDALAYLGECGLIDFDIPLADVKAVLGESPVVSRVTNRQAIAHLPLNRSLTAHKYKAGNLLLIAGSRQYAGAAMLAGLGAIASGVGMLTLAVPESIRLALLPQMPSTLLIGCPETESGAIAALPDHIDLSRYDAIAFGPGLTPTVPTLLTQVFAAHCPLLLDADGLNLLASNNPIQQLKTRESPTILTPHLGEFRRLFPTIQADLPGDLALKAAQASGAIVLLKGPRSAIGDGQKLWLNPVSTPALARGGSGDVLTGLMGGLVAAAHQSGSQSGSQSGQALTSAVTSAVWWHSQAAIYAEGERSRLGVDPLHLARSLNPALQTILEAGD